MTAICARAGAIGITATTAAKPSITRDLSAFCMVPLLFRGDQGLFGRDCWRSGFLLEAPHRIGRVAEAACFKPGEREVLGATLRDDAIHPRVVFGARGSDEGERGGAESQLEQPAACA